jgi:nicotinic acid phosphoribosyltransferase
MRILNHSKYDLYKFSHRNAYVKYPGDLVIFSILFNPSPHFEFGIVISVVNYTYTVLWV